MDIRSGMSLKVDFRLSGKQQLITKFFCLYRSSDQESYSIEFVFDADVKCAVTVHYMATEDLSTGLAM